MKKTIFLFLLLATLLIAGCNEKNLISQIDGTWHLQKYAVNGVDMTTTFDTTHAGYTMTFANGDLYTESWFAIKLYTLYTLDTLTHYDTTTHTFVIDSITASKAIVPTGYQVIAQGQWYLTNGNQFLETRDSLTGTRLFQIVDHSSGNLHLLYGNQDFYLSK